METSSSQFVLWMEYLEWDINAFDKTCYYLAQIAAMVVQVNSKKGVRVKVEDFIMKFTHNKTDKPIEDVQIRTSKAKQFFFGLTGLMGKQKKRKR